MSQHASLARTICMLTVSMSTTFFAASIIPREAAATEERRSGTVLAIDRLDQATATLVVRVGPWRRKDEDGVPGSVPLRIMLKPSTAILVVTRAARRGSEGREEDLIKTSSSAEALTPGVYVTVTYTETGPLLVANRVEVIADPLGLSRVPPSGPSGLTIHPK